MQEDYCCLIAALFFPWSFDNHLNPHNISWKQFFHDNRHHLSPRLSRYIDNLDLLHKTREETRIDYLLRRSQEALQVPGDLSSTLFDDNIEAVVEAADEFDDSDRLYSTVVDQAISTLIEPGDDWYTREALDSCEDNGYLQSSPSSSKQSIYYSPQPLNVLRESLKSLSAIAATTATSQAFPITVPLATSNHEIQPYVFLTDSAQYEHAILDIVNRFTLNDEQKLAIHIITDHSTGQSKVGAQLLIGIFGEGGTGKSHLIKAICVWFAALSHLNELIITAMTGTAAFNVKGCTLHSAVGILVENGDGVRVMTMSDKKAQEWQDHHYLIVDEVSMMDCKVIRDCILNFVRPSHCLS